MQSNVFRQSNTMQSSGFGGFQTAFSQPTSQPFQNASLPAQPPFGGTIGMSPALPASNPTSSFMTSSFKPNPSFGANPTQSINANQTQSTGFSIPAMSGFTAQTAFRGGTQSSNSPFSSQMGYTQSTTASMNPQFGDYNPAMSQLKGTLITKYKPSLIQEDKENASVSHLTAISEYKNKCTEEIRFEDYKSNDGHKKNTPSGMNQAMGQSGLLKDGFGGATGGGVFGNTVPIQPVQQLPIFGEKFQQNQLGKPQQSGVFGANMGGNHMGGIQQPQQNQGVYKANTASNPLVQPGIGGISGSSGGVFGAQTIQTQGPTSLFGQPNQNFQQTPTQSQGSTSLFGQPNQSSQQVPTSQPSLLFGQQGQPTKIMNPNTQSPNRSLFGGSQSSFSQPTLTSQPQLLFGGTSQSQPGGAPQPASLFGGITQSQPSGTPQPASLFGGTSQSQPGGTPQPASLFGGANQPQLSGTSQPNLSFGGTSHPQPGEISQPSLPFGGTSQPHPGGLFPSTPQNPGGMTTPQTGSLCGQPSPGLLGNAVQQQGGSISGAQPQQNQPSFLSSNPQQASALLFGQPQQTLYSESQMQPQMETILNAAKDPHGINWLFPGKPVESILDDYKKKLASQQPETRTLVNRVQPSQKGHQEEQWRQNIDKKSYTHKKNPEPFGLISTPARERFTITKRPSFEGSKLQEYQDENNAIFFKVISPSPSVAKRIKTTEILVVAYNPYPIRMTIPVNLDTQIKEIRYQFSRHIENIELSCIQLAYKSKILKDSDTIKSMNMVHHDVIDVIVTEDENKPKLAPQEMLPKLTKPGYKLKPSIVELARMTVDELKRVKHFTVENVYGKIIFDGQTNIISLDLDKLVEIREKEVIVYMDENDANKPKIGESLNKPATIYIFNCKPKKKMPPELFINRLKKICEKSQSEFVSWNQNNGEWIFTVKHFNF